MEIKDIIKEELQGLLKEGYVMEHDNFKFRQKVENCSFYNFQPFSNDFDVDISESDIIINWRIGFSLNDMGINNFLVQADSVEGTYHLMLLNKQSDEVEQDDDKNIAEIPWRFQIYEASMKKGESLYIDSLEFDFKTKICTVEFYDSDTAINESVRPKLNEGREHLVDYFKTMWSASEGVRNLISGSSYMTKKYGQYLDPRFNWDSLDDNELQRIWDEWSVDEQLLNSQSKF